MDDERARVVRKELISSCSVRMGELETIGRAAYHRIDAAWGLRIAAGSRREERLLVRSCRCRCRCACACAFHAPAHEALRPSNWEGPRRASAPGSVPAGRDVSPSLHVTAMEPMPRRALHRVWRGEVSAAGRWRARAGVRARLRERHRGRFPPSSGRRSGTILAFSRQRRGMETARHLGAMPWTRGGVALAADGLRA